LEFKTLYIKSIVFTSQAVFEGINIHLTWNVAIRYCISYVLGLLLVTKVVFISINTILLGKVL
jgi:hypothetical protein